MRCCTIVGSRPAPDRYRHMAKPYYSPGNPLNTSEIVGHGAYRDRLLLKPQLLLRGSD